MSNISHHKLTVSPHDEDNALFAPPLGQCKVSLIPKFRTNADGERVIHGLLSPNAEVEVLFAGRRRALADPLMERLNYLWERAQSQGTLYGSAKPEQIQLPVAIYGSWRSRFSRDEDGWQTKRHQLVAAIWRIKDTTGRPITRGSAPMLNQSRSRLPGA